MATVLSEWPRRFASQNDLDNLRDDCTQENTAIAVQISRNHSELMDAVKSHYPGAETRQYIATQTKSVEQTMQITAAAQAAPLWRQLWDTITGNKWLALACLILAGAMVKGLIGFLEQLLILINNTTAHILH